MQFASIPFLVQDYTTFCHGGISSSTPYDVYAKVRDFQVGEEVYMRQIPPNLNNGQFVCRLDDHIHKKHISTSAAPDLITEELSVESVDIPIVTSQADAYLVETDANGSEHLRKWRILKMCHQIHQMWTLQICPSISEPFGVLLVSSIFLITSAFTFRTNTTCSPRKECNNVTVYSY